MTAINMVSTLGSAWTVGLTGGLTGLYGAGPQVTNFTRVGPAMTADACLAGCASRALSQAMAGGLTRGQAQAVAANPRLFPANFGTQVHAALEQEVLLAKGSGQLSTSIQITPRGTFGPDVFDPVSGKWWDLTTQQSWVRGIHQGKYNGMFGRGTGLLYNRGSSNVFIAK